MPESNDSPVGAYDARTHFSELLERVENGEEFTITRHGSPVARLIPVKKATTRKTRKTAIQRWRESTKRPTLGALKLRELISKGRR